VLNNLFIASFHFEKARKSKHLKILAMKKEKYF